MTIDEIMEALFPLSHRIKNRKLLPFSVCWKQRPKQKKVLKERRARLTMRMICFSVMKTDKFCFMNLRQRKIWSIIAKIDQIFPLFF